MLRLVLIALEVEIVDNSVVSAFFFGREDYLHVELAPPFLGDAEWRRGHCCNGQPRS